MAYKIIRFYSAEDSKVIKTGLTLDQAREHCSDPETSSQTCTAPELLDHTAIYGAWFDGYNLDS